MRKIVLNIMPEGIANSYIIDYPMESKPNSHIIPETQMYFVCIKDDVENKMIKLLKYNLYNSEAMCILLEWEMISKKK